MLSWEIRNDGLVFSFSNQSIDKWPTSTNVGLSYLFQLRNEERVVLRENSFLEVSFSEIAKIPVFLLPILNLPPVSPFSIKLETSGSLLRDNFELGFQFFNGSTPLIGAALDGVFIVKGEQKFLICDPIFSSIQIIERLRVTKDSNSKLCLLKKLKDILPAEIFEGDNRLKSFNLVQGRRLTIDIKSPDDFTLVPELLLSNEENGSLLPPHQNQKFKEQFFKFNTAVGKYQVSPNTFVFLESTLIQICEVIKKANQKPLPERKEFFFNPKKHIKDALPNIEDEMLEDLFVENELFVSQRISHIGVWEPKVNAFVPKGSNNWIPKDYISIVVNDSVIVVDPDEIEKITEIAKSAQKEGKEFIDINGQTVKLTPDLIQVLDETKSKIDETIKDISKFLPDTDLPRTKKEILRYVAIIKDNLDKNFYSETNSHYKKLEKSLPTNLKTTSLYDYQKLGIAWLQESFIQGKRGVILADDMGLGKTLQTLTFLSWLREKMINKEIDKKPILIVGPTGLLENWKNEHDTHLDEDGLGRCLDGYGTKFRALRENSYNNVIRSLADADWVLTTYDTLRDQEKYFRAVQWGCIVFDESQAIKNPNSLKTDMAKAMAADFSIAVTGTPVENSLCDLWCISDTVFPGKLGLYKNFKDRYEKTGDNLRELKQIIVDNLPSFMMRRLKVDNLRGLPKRSFEIRYTEMTKSQSDLYSDVIARFKAGEYKNARFQVIHDLKRISIFDAQNFAKGIDHQIKFSGKIQLLIKILQEIKLRNEKVLLFLENRELQTLLIPYLQTHFNMSKPILLINGTINGKLRKQRVNEFQQRSEGFDIMVISPKAGGTGLTITAANNVIHLDRWWNPAIEDQCNDRCYRIGQKKDVTVYLLLNLHPEIKEGSFDYILHKALENKRELTRDIIVPPDLSKEEMQDIYFKVTGEKIKFTDEEENFYSSEEWRILKAQVYATYDRRCMKCSAINVDMHVDHIKPRSKFPDLALVFDNLQVLCSKCNVEKSNTDYTDYRDVEFIIYD